MANINKDYNKAEADNIFKKYNELSRFNPLIKTRETKAVYFRALLYKVLMDFNYMNDRQIADYFLTKGKKMNRVSILQAVKKIGIYYRDFADFRNLYDVYFADKTEENILLKKRQNDRINKLNTRVSKTASKKDNDALNNLINDLPLDRRSEVLERLELMVKSWSWKSRDKCEIIESSSGISEVTF
jgi:hypothetical protein